MLDVKLIYFDKFFLKIGVLIFPLFSPIFQHYKYVRNFNILIIPKQILFKAICWYKNRPIS